MLQSCPVLLPCPLSRRARSSATRSNGTTVDAPSLPWLCSIISSETIRRHCFLWSKRTALSAITQGLERANWDLLFYCDSISCLSFQLLLTIPPPPPLA